MKKLTLALLALGALAAPLAAQTKITGAGSTFSTILYTDWMQTYNKAHSDVQLNYQSIGSGGGIRQFSDRTVDFGASDAPMTDSAIGAIKGNVLHIPTEMGGVPPTYNVPGIYLGTITKWNDARIAADNPGVRLPDMDVVVVHRSDGSGTSFIFTDYLSKVSPEWASKVGKGTAVNWPVGLGAKGSEGVSATVQQTPGAIGYVELGYALANHLPVGAVKNKAGKFVAASAASVTAAAASAMKAMGASTDFRVSITDPDGADAYPISSFTWMLVRKDYDDAAKAKALVAYTWWALTTGQGRCDELGYAPIPKAMQPWLEARLKTITASGTAVWSGPAGR
jgi:phosphate transport system substrate-binding protein